MEKKKVKIVVLGQSGTGKSLISLMIGEILKSTGFEYQIKDPDSLTLEEFEEMKPEALEELRGSISIEIEVVQTHPFTNEPFSIQQD